MFRRDFLMQMIEQLRGLLPYVLDLARAGNYDEAHAVLNQAVRELVGVGTNGVVNLPDDVIIERLQADNMAAWQDKCLFLTAVLYEEAQMLVEQEAIEAAYGRYIKALNLLLTLAFSDDEVRRHTDLTPDIEQIVSALAGYHLPGYTCLKLMAYYEQMGVYTAVENILFDWLENAPEQFRTNNTNPGQAGLEFFLRLRHKSPAELQMGGLNQAEVEIAIMELCEMGYDQE